MLGTEFSAYNSSVFGFAFWVNFNSTMHLISIIFFFFFCWVSVYARARTPELKVISMTWASKPSGASFQSWLSNTGVVCIFVKSKRIV